MIPARDLRQALRWTLLALAPCAALALAFGLAFDPAQVGSGEPWRLLGLEAPVCPGCWLCGMSRAFSALGHGRWTEAFESHPGVLLAWSLAWSLVLAAAAQLGRSLAPRRWTWRSPR